MSLLTVFFWRAFFIEGFVLLLVFIVGEATAAILERSLDKRIRIDLDCKAARHVVTGDDSQLQNAPLRCQFL